MWSICTQSKLDFCTNYLSSISIVDLKLCEKRQTFDDSTQNQLILSQNRQRFAFFRRTSSQQWRLKKGSQYGSPTLIEYLLTTFNNFQPHFVKKVRSRVAYFLAVLPILFLKEMIDKVGHTSMHFGDKMRLEIVEACQQVLNQSWTSVLATFLQLRNYVFYHGENDNFEKNACTFP